ncbi:hypothetical protein BHE74_00047545 [Ensete ventricosum]|uniref:Non-haem dioxygenase N-terminal domain-containing protein n=1 Tax=Ensete ventricosum TaxID=4639 RepID=A0A445MI40_ENSVE|nr:hypothetical protein BHE74_00047545 [Ensete ventricosum]RZR73866.1 hypothetical protein BHM03_00029039 [Ensete ventricosum]
MLHTLSISSSVLFLPHTPYKYLILTPHPLLSLSCPPPSNHAPRNYTLLSPPLPMDCNPTSILLRTPLDLNKERDAGAGGFVFNSSVLGNQASIPKAFIWPQCHRPATIDELDAPVVDLGGFLRCDEASTARAVEYVRAACSTHGFFQVANHGVDASLAREAMDCVDGFFKLPLCHKLRARRKPGNVWGYTGAHADRFSSELPWKETLSFGYREAGGGDLVVVDYFASILGHDFERTG